MSKKLIHVARQKLPVAFLSRATFLSSVEEQSIIGIYFCSLIGIYFCSLDPLGGVTLGCHRILFPTSSYFMSQDTISIQCLDHFSLIYRQMANRQMADWTTPRL